MKREEAIRNVAIALGIGFKELERELERMGESIKQLGEDMDRAVEVFGKIKALAKSQPQKIKSYVSPYAKFDRLHKKNRKRK